MKEYLKETSEVLAEQNTSENGLSDGEAAERLSRFGQNKLEEAKKTSVIVRFLKSLTDPMIIVLLAAAAISSVTEIHEGGFPTDAIIILIVVIINSILSVVQESKAEAAIEALSEMTAAQSKAIRDGKSVVIPAADLVPGDIVLLDAGDAVPADGRIIECASMKAEEAALTGESVPVDKKVEAIASESGEVPLGDRKNMVYTGSTIVYGHGKMVVTDTGMNTEMGKIAGAIAAAEEGQTPLQRKLSELSKLLTFLVLGICVILFVFNVIKGIVTNTLSPDTVLDTFMVAISLAVAAIPEGLAAVVTIVLSMGVTKMSNRNAVIRKLTAVETLGCTQIICSDKTGTLTQNKMTVVEDFSDDKELLAKAMCLCCDAVLNEETGNSDIGDPTECALVNHAFKLGMAKPDLEAAAPRIGEAPFDSMRKMMTTVHDEKGRLVQYTKGATDVILSRCTSYMKNGSAVPMTDEKKAEILAENKTMADRALRVLCAAVRYWDEKPESWDSSYLEQELCYVGIVGMIDPVRPEVMAAVEECRNAHIRPIMITGDHIDTATAIANTLGILDGGRKAITGAELDKISDEQLAEDIELYSVYARVQPEHKTRIVNAWRSKGMITAMTGDGVNDAPSIKSADIGVGMGITGTDVTKNVADMVLADDNFATIVTAVEEGRRIYDNIRKTIQFLLASNLSEVISIFVATLCGFTILKPPHLLWINLITDTFPALALGTEQAEKDIMNRAPRDSKEGVFAGGMMLDILLQGAIVSVLTLIAYAIGRSMNGADHGITMAFLTLSMTEVFHAFNMRSRRKSVFSMKSHNKLLWITMIASFLLTLSVTEIPFLREAFSFTAIGLAEYAIAMGLAVVIIPIVELIKLIQRKTGHGEE